MPKVSICIPAYNNADEVKHLLDTIFEQEYTDYEINISDDSTNDEIKKVVNKFNETDNKINYHHNKKGLGHIFNWNAAINMATGEYVKIMFSDDWFTDKNSLSKFVEMLDKNPQANIAFSGSRQVMFDNQKVKHITKEHMTNSYDRYADKEFIDNLKSDYRNLFLGNQIGAPSAVIYRRGKELTLFDEKSNWASDMFLYFELLKDNGKFEYTTLPLISIGVHENQYTEGFAKNDMRIYNDYKYMYKKYNLCDCYKCKEFFAQNFIITYHKGYKEAKQLGISAVLYWKKWIGEKVKTIECFIKSRLSK